MTVYDLVEKLGGEVCRGKARARIDGQWVILGQLNGDDMVFTEEGRALAAEDSEETPRKRGRPAKTAIVESVEPPSEEVAPVEEQEQPAPPDTEPIGLSN